jgi:hypothetical protein
MSFGAPARGLAYGRDDVRVHAEGDRRLGVAEPVGDLIHRHPGGEQQAGMGVPDQAALRGVHGLVERLGLELFEVGACRRPERRGPAMELAFAGAAAAGVAVGADRQVRSRLLCSARTSAPSTG